MPGGYEINEYQLPLDFTEEERERFNNVGFSDEFKRQILTQKEGGWGMVGTWKVTNRTKDGVAYTKIPVNESNMVDVGECYTGRIIDRLAAYEDSGLSPEEVQKLEKSDASKEQCIIDQHGEIHRLRDELKRYKQAEQEGRLYNLPLKPGDTIYRPEALQFCWVITKVEIYEDEIVFIDDSDNIFEIDDIGKTVFLTREEAEKAKQNKLLF